MGHAGHPLRRSRQSRRSYKPQRYNRQSSYSPSVESAPATRAHDFVVPMLIRAQGVRLDRMIPQSVPTCCSDGRCVEACLAPRCAPSARSVPDASFFQFIGDLLFASGPNDRDLVRRSWHSIQRERRGKRPLLDMARSEDRDLVWTDGETRNFVLW